METGSRYLASIGQAVQASYALSPLTHAMAVRNAIGLAATLVLAMTFLNPSAALVGGMGAIAVAVADRPGLDVTKAPRMLWTVGGAAVAAFMGALLGGHTSTEIAAVSVAAFCVGVLSAYGTGSLQSGVASILVLLVAATQSESFIGSLGLAGVVIVAGLLQTLLSLSAAPAPARNPDGHALERVFLDLASYVRAPNSRGEVPAAMALAQAPAYQQAFAMYRSSADREPLLESVHRLQSEIMALVEASERFLDVQPELYDRWSQARRLMAESLEGTGHLLVGDSTLTSVEASIAQVRSQLITLAGELKSADSRQIGSWRKLARELLAHLDAAVFLANSQREDRIGGMAPRAVFGVMRDRGRATVQLVRLNVRARSPMLRHAIRLTIAVVIACMMPVILDIPQWYWSPLAVLIILRPYLSDTVQRMWESWLGLVIGLMVGTVVAAVFHELTWAMVAIIGLFLFLQRLYGASNAGFGITMIAAMIVGLLALAHSSASDALLDRVLNIVIGGVIAVAIHYAWPSWERLRTRDLVAECMDRYRDVFAMVVPGSIGQTQSEFTAIMLRRTIARAARASAEESIRRQGTDPGLADAAQQTMSDLLTQLRLVVWSTLRLEAYARMLAGEDLDQELMLAFLEFQRSSERVLQDASYGIAHERVPGRHAASVTDAVIWMHDVLAHTTAENKESPVFSWYGVVMQAQEHADRLQRIEDHVLGITVMSGEGHQR